jgi:nucleoside-diphosphate-sugar epimerase
MTAVHLHGTRALVEAAAGRIGRWVQLSSTGAYGTRREGVVTEDTELRPVNVYETTKAGSDAIVARAAADGAFPYVVLRPSNVYAGDMTNRSLFGLVSMVDKGLFFFIGRPGASANYVHVQNVVDAIVLCGSDERAIGRVYNLSDHRPLEEFISLVSLALGKPSPPRLRVPEAVARGLVRLLPRLPLTGPRIDALTSRVVYSSARIEQELGFRLSVPMEVGVRDLVDSWKRQRTSP